MSPYTKSLVEKSLSDDFVFKSRAMQVVMEEIMKVSKYDCNVIIFGSTGVGKEKVANLIQKQRPQNAAFCKNKLRSNLAEPD